MDIDLQGMVVGVQDFIAGLPDTLRRWYGAAIKYFESLSLYEMIAWGGNGLGLVLVIVALVLW